MDYGKENNFDLDNLNLDTNEMSWNNTPDRDPRALGNKVISFPESPNPTPGPEDNSASPSLDPAITSPQPGEAQPSAAAAPDANGPIVINFSDLKTKEDRLDPKAVEVVDQAIHKLDQDGNIADFYETARNMTEAHLENSYNRKLAA